MNNTKKILKRAEEAVSPVVATLMLVLVAAGAAVGISVFMGGIQDDAEANLSTDVSNGNTLKIAGSSTVQPITNDIIPLFEAAHPGIKVVNEGGGSGFGRDAVGRGLVDIGARSNALQPEDFSNYPDFDLDGSKDIGAPELVETVIGYDGVAVFVNAGGCLGATEDAWSMPQSLMRDIYGFNGGVSGYTATGTYDADYDNSDAVTVAFDITDGLTWGEFEAYLEETHPGADFGDCSAVSTELLQVYDRADKGGTSELFCSDMLGDKSSKDICGDGKQITETDAPNLIQKEGNQGVEAALAGNTLGIGFSSFGTGSGNSDLSFQKFDGQTPNTDDIKSGDYSVSRVLEYVTVGEPSGAAKLFIDFVKDPTLNEDVLHAHGYVALID